MLILICRSAVMLILRERRSGKGQQANCDDKFEHQVSPKNDTEN